MNSKALLHLTLILRALSKSMYIFHEKYDRTKRKFTTQSQLYKFMTKYPS